MEGYGSGCWKRGIPAYIASAAGTVTRFRGFREPSAISPLCGKTLLDSMSKKHADEKPYAVLPRASARAVFATLPRTFRATAFKPSANLPRTVLRRFTYVYYHRLRVDMGCPKMDSGSLQGLGETAVERKKVREH